MTFSVSSSPHQHIKRRTDEVMRLVMYAGIPGLLLQTWYFGWGTIIQFVLAALVAVVTEAVVLEVRKKNFERAIRDCSAILTAFLLALCIPPFAPWWLTVLGSVFAIGIVKQLYGGLGYNPFNPAMAAYVMLLVSFPVHMTNWLPPAELALHGHGLSDAFFAIFTGYSADGYSLAQMRTDIDGVTLATPLDQLKTDLTQGLTVTESLNQPVFFSGLGIGWFMVNLAYLAGGLALIKMKVINWHIPGGFLAGLFVLSTAHYLADSDLFASPIFHLFSGGAMLGAFFIATDPVSASTTNRGRIIFGAGIGAWVYIIRVYGGYPDAVAFAVLIMNMCVPLIDYYTRPRTYGEGTEHKKSIRQAKESGK